MRTFHFLLILCVGLLTVGQVNAFCGFYVAKADAKLFNKSSQVIIARDGNKTVITMANDFQGSVKDFAMVVPVPEVLQRKNIRIADQLIFDKLDAYSAPRVAEYHDNNPCYRLAYDLEEVTESIALKSVSGNSRSVKKEKDFGVTIEATYTVGEYDILILSANQSNGLERWLTTNGYKIPNGASDVLQPYIKSDMKFFVVKVNLDKHKSSGFTNLRPIQIAFTSDKFMLPIRLGMANADHDQDLIVYAFTKSGRVEAANYRTVKMPSNVNVPEFIKTKFNPFYKDLFETTWKREGKKAVMLEYAWDLSSSNFVKCDPCVTTPPIYKDLREAGAFWMQPQVNRGGSNYSGNLFMTRLHVRYNRTTFPQDLKFIATPNKERFQGRYVVQNAVKGDLQCEQAQPYYKKVVQRREKEIQQLASLTGWNVSDHQYYVREFASKIKGDDDNGWIENDFDRNSMIPVGGGSSGGGPGGLLFILMVVATGWYLLKYHPATHRRLAN